MDDFIFAVVEETGEKSFKYCIDREVVDSDLKDITDSLVV